ncbi:YuzD family protein [Sporosarcina obsidiansis]|uniref:YuzD family protein n=1 Tax=Sporosarcina obsidiansis TaxID=2660748 RepID=UPI00129A52B4|nr:YuzD family protein [Sporosarcina obsidiansis]
MSTSPVTIEIYGADVICASCVNAPSSKDTYEWLEAALSRKYPNQPFSIAYIDINKEITDVRQQEIAEKVREEEYFYPLVMIEDEMIGEGHIQLKPVFTAMEAHGYQEA